MNITAEEPPDTAVRRQVFDMPKQREAVAGHRFLHPDTLPALEITNIPGRLSYIKQPA